MGFLDRLTRTLDELSEGLLPDEAQGRITAARELLGRGEARAAAATLTQIVAERPDHATAQALLGRARLALGEPAAALAAFDASLVARPGFGEALVGQGDARRAAGDHSGALAAYREVIGAAGGDKELLADAYRGLGLAHLAAGDAARALRELRKALLTAPDDDTRAALGRVLLAVPVADRAAARALLATDIATPAPLRLAAARLALDDGELPRAEALLAAARPALPGDLATDGALLAAEVALAAGRPAEAHRAALEALATSKGAAAAYLMLARGHLAVKNFAAALDAALCAEQLGDASGATLALEIALAEPPLAAKVAPLANARLAAAPDDATALAVRGLALAEIGEPDAARGALARALAAGEVFHAPLALARLTAAAGALDDASALAQRALAARPGDAAARALLVDLRRRALGLADLPPGGELRPLAHAITRVLGQTPALVAAAHAVEAALAAYDRPLLVAVMGEFSAGKSTFVNAFLGAALAPMGATPTTATINVLKMGRTRHARLLFRDDRERELGWDQVGEVLRGLSEAEAAAVQVVELFAPLEALERVNLVDTPGWNSLHPEHERTARRLLGEADAVIWLSSAQQVGKASEAAAIAQLATTGARLLGVINKVDQLDADERAQVLAHARAALGERFVDIVEVSARRALAAREQGDAQALAASGWPALEAALERHFLAGAKALKRKTATRRLVAAIGEGRAHAQDALARLTARKDALAAAADGLATAAAAFGALADDAARDLAHRLRATLGAAAREVLDVVVPRKIFFGEHSAQPADRDHLLQLLEAQFAAALEPARARAHAALDAAATAAASAIRAHHPDEAEALLRLAADGRAQLDAAVFARVRAYVGGYLRGGWIDDFFARVLPRLELAPDTVAHALARAAPDLAAEVRAPLASEGQAVLARLGARITALLAHAELAAFELEAITLDGLDGLERLIQASAPPEAAP